MPDTANFESREVKINLAIQKDVDTILSQPSFQLPRADAGIVQSYVQKIQGTYDVERAKKDTDNAIDLLYIAYNTTPQEEGDVRVRISAIMNKLITTQQQSELTMRDAISVAGNIGKSLSDVFPDWQDIREGNDQSEIKSFVSKDLITLAKTIRDRALNIRDRLLVIASTYDEIIRSTADTTAKSEMALSNRLADKKAIEREINEANAKREQLESLVEDLKSQVAEFEKKARDYEQRASTAEQRAFVMSIVRVGAQMISSAVPAIAMAAGGPAPMLASSIGGLLSGQTGSKSDSQSASDGQPAPSKSKTDDTARTQTQLSEGKAELRKSEEKRDALQTEIKQLQASKAELATGSGNAAEAAELEKRISARSAELKAQEEAIAKQKEIISSLQGSLDALDKGLGKLTDEQQQQAASLRQIQMQMIDKAEAYEKERRNQTAELIKITALLKGKRSEDETLQLTIKSLNLSLSALKRMKEIVEEIAFFFKSFADFMQSIAEEADHQVTSIDNVAQLETIRKNRLAQLIRSVDEFFIRQAAQWHAVTTVSDRFNKSFADGWSKLNKLSGEYITGDRLSAYLQTASARLAAIVAEREAASDAKIASLNAYRESLTRTG